MKKKTKKKIMTKIKNLPKKKIGIICLALTITILLFVFRDVIFCPYPTIVIQYRNRYNQMAIPKYLEEFRGFTNGSYWITGHTSNGTYLELSLNDSIAGLNYSQLLEWEHKHLMYWKDYLQARPEMPIEILTTNLLFSYGEFIALGRCGEFALLYNGLLLSNGYRSRIVVDCSIKTDNRVAGDHVWNEILINEEWIHIDPTEQIIDSPDLYSNPDKWNKNVNLVYGIEGNEITNLTDKYR